MLLSQGIDGRIVRAFVRARKPAAAEEAVLWTDVLLVTNAPVADIVQHGLVIANH